MIQPTTNPTYTVISNHGFAEIVQNSFTQQRSLHAFSAFNAGDILCSFSAGKTLSQPTYLTVQVDEEKHITLHPEFLQYINHSCNPNVFFDTTSFRLIALTNIEAGDEFTFFYPSTEWNMAQPFNCFCNTAKCLHQIQGAVYLDDAVLKQYRLTDFIQQQINKR
ncbi:MAG TPA: SET domain-containing protein-lysine N-methyltransferase [Chitinophagaceae bacterium]|nr:SET domain-containing protein-lysine N-methyltransferase [Chitinophagaceae bacterium]